MTPVLESERLILRGWQREDFPAYAAFCADAKRTLHTGGQKDAFQAWTAFSSMVGAWALNGYGMFAVEPKDADAVAGFVGLWHPPAIDEPELAWSLYEGFEGRGYAVEAARRVQVWAAEDLKLPPLMSFVHPDNLASQAVAKRLGAEPMSPTELRGEPRLRFRHVLPA
ncbi:GNAT family N-acetyltransferase [Nitratireductor aquibiodomus]|uniref:Protein N-acetyltransferase, RimJ/RimL family n=1 Tax=Nitratireductor aquibiodomus TaxID=204799 RepID=A0A1H4KLB1_9HYPH|nr:GNAT family N-acetyltransferase [Nitratireductor aquibiodomus]SEB59349.1 Protein N-acetyltransferase, RimJ/RimL family [Nitratireductor aquibiodomus]